jgi:23S rRNA (guanine745-N1)-methyltransferase
VLVCPVRNCGLPLQREPKRCVCPNRHSFDIARSGYLNLLQPQDRKSKEPGDTRAAIAGRRNLHDQGFTQPLLRAIAEAAAVTQSDIVLDAGCGEGFYLGSLQRETNCQAHGVDISIPAIEAAARRYPGSEWVVANADRFIPYADRSFSLVLSITARMNAPEFRRVVRDDGRLLVAIPAPDDLVELRGAGRDRVQRTIETFAPAFTLDRQTRVSTTADLDPPAVQEVLHSIYRPLQSKPVGPARVTFALDLLLFRPLRAGC